MQAALSSAAGCLQNDSVSGVHGRNAWKLAVGPCLPQPGDYGRLRTWASLSWTAFAPLAGWVNSTYGIRWGSRNDSG